jgi:hypothetical protein
LNFNVGSCNQDNDCGIGVCCPSDSSEAGKCKTSTDECYASIASSVYEWEFSTGGVATSTPPTYYSCLGRSYDTGKCDPLTCPNSPGTCSPYTNEAAGVSTCECCCRIGEAGDCCAPLVCEGNCGSDASDVDTNTYGYCSGCANVGTTQAEHDAACNCGGTGGKVCDTSLGGGVCRDCQQLSSAEQCSQHTTCCVDAKNGNICRGGIGNTDMINYNNLSYCQYYQCNISGDGCDLGNNPVASSTRSVYETSGECGIKCSQESRPGQRCVATTTPAITCNPNFNCGVGYQCLEFGVDTCGTCCCDPSIPQISSNGLQCVADKAPCDGGSRGLYCGCEDDQDCSSAATSGCSFDTCCRARPSIVGIYPADNITGICRNTLISANFNQQMNISSFSGNMIVAGDYGNSNCPDGIQPLSLNSTVENKNIFVSVYSGIAEILKGVSKLFYGDSALAGLPDPAHNYCAVSGNVNGIHNTSTTTSIIFSPNKPLDASRTYYVIIKGDEDLDSSQGVLNGWNIGMNGPDTATLNGTQYVNAKIWSFTTGSEVCKLDSVKIDPTSYLFKTSINNTGDDNAAAISSFDTIADSDKIFYAKAMSGNGQQISPTADYNWEWNWLSENENIAEVSNSNNSTQVVTAKNVRDGKTFIKAKATITEDRISTISTAGQSKTGQSEVYVFLCENPWPSVVNGIWEPWKDSSQGMNCLLNTGDCTDTSYEFYYCRDDGASGPDGDLPAILSEDTIIRGRSIPQNILKEAYFFREETTE